ncbi:MAG: hypothetical protein ACRDKT_04555 [Actinomycetota bacterium]
MDAVEDVKQFLRGQNLEQLGRRDEAIGIYEEIVAQGFDSIGPYDRLITIYSSRSLHDDVVRISELALANVHTYEEKRDFYAQTKEAALRAASDVPKAAPKRRA